MMGRLRERPRLVAARVLAVALVLVTGVAIGALGGAADTGPTAPALAKTQLADRLDQTSAELERVRAEREATLARSQRLTRTTSRLRSELRDAKRVIKRAKRTRRSRSR